jgi:mono/diheme cytochrome c family protein
MKNTLLCLLFLSALSLVGLPAARAGLTAPAPGDPDVERGRYLVRVSGCNDCHTPGYIMNDGNVPEAQWLTGDNFGWRGPWGTTYGANLRLFVKDMPESQWIEVAKTLKRRPPMPWYNLNSMDESDLRAVYRFIRSLGEPGLPAHAWVPPDVEPDTPYATFPSPPPTVQ